MGGMLGYWILNIVFDVIQSEKMFIISQRNESSLSWDLGNYKKKFFKSGLWLHSVFRIKAWLAK